jgi:hypothetical protein
VNPLGNMSRKHNTLQVLLYMHNLPPSLAMHEEIEVHHDVNACSSTLAFT